MTNRWANPA